MTNIVTWRSDSINTKGIEATGQRIVWGQVSKLGSGVFHSPNIQFTHALLVQDKYGGQAESFLGENDGRIGLLNTASVATFQ